MTKLTDLIDAVGLDNIEVQELDSCATDFVRGRNRNKITFATDQEWDFRNLAGPTEKYGLILWMDREEVEAYRRAINADH